MNADGTVTYDPSQSPQIQALTSGQTADDTFKYTMQVGHGVTSTANVTVHLTGVNDSIAKVLDEVPAYNWYHGCGPTASASVIGYYDLHGYPQLFDAQGWDAVRLTENVQDQISSPQHNAKYDSTPDDLTLPVPPPTSLADFMHTSLLDFGQFLDPIRSPE
jgi:hypothetical protein